MWIMNFTGISTCMDLSSNCANFGKDNHHILSVKIVQTTSSCDSVIVSTQLYIPVLLLSIGGALMRHFNSI